MQLTRRYAESGAVINYTQVGHRHSAVEYAVAGIAKIQDINLDQLGRNPLTSEMEGSMRDWVIETLLQGAYLREYHLWEKDCKAYFIAMAKRNDVILTMKGNEPFTSLVRGILSRFQVTVPDDILSAIENMRQRVNVMKHEAGLQLDHFIRRADYEAAVGALEKFWEHLSRCERVIY